MMTRQFKQRLLIGTFGIICLVLSICFSFHPLFKPIFVLLNAVVIGTALREYYKLCQLKGHRPLIVLGISSASLYLFALAWSFSHPYLEGLPGLILLLTLLLAFFPYFKAPSFALCNLALTFFGLVYLVIPLSSALRINYFFAPTGSEDGRLWLAYALLVSKMTDIGGYVVGKCYGKTKLAPLISPKKTIEGSLGGLIAALAISLCFVWLVGLWTPSFRMTVWQSIWIAIVLSLLAQLGDLAESVLKRDAGVKDSSHLPGFGGILDVVDSLVFSLPFMYLLLQMKLVGT